MDNLDYFSSKIIAVNSVMGVLVALVGETYSFPQPRNGRLYGPDVSRLSPLCLPLRGARPHTALRRGVSALQAPCATLAAAPETVAGRGGVTREPSRRLFGEDKAGCAACAGLESRTTAGLETSATRQGRGASVYPEG